MIMTMTEGMLDREWMPQVRWTNGNNVTLNGVREAIQREADENGIPVAFSEDQVKLGGLFSRDREDVLRMYNPEHPNDYLHFVIRVKHQGKYAFMNVYNLGGSKNYRDYNAAQAGSAFRMVTNLLSGTNSKMQAEENYYTILKDCLANVVR